MRNIFSIRRHCIFEFFGVDFDEVVVSFLQSLILKVYPVGREP